MDPKYLTQLLADQIKILKAARDVLRESHVRVAVILAKSESEELTPGERESCEALTSRFARLSDFLFMRAFRTLDQLELSDDGSGIDRLNRMEKRGVINSSLEWRFIRELRNSIAHEYLLERSDTVLKEAFRCSEVLFKTVEMYLDYCTKKIQA